MALAKDGFDVAISATRADHLARTVAELEPLGKRVLPIVLDLRSTTSINTAISEVVATLGGIDVLVNNAATSVRKRAIDLTPAEWNAVINVNVTGTFFLTQQVGRHLIERACPGSIINIASVHGILGVAERCAYGVSKAAIIQMTRMLAVEWAENAIRVNAVAPGRLLTESPSRATTAQDQHYMDAMLKRIPLHRFATVDEVAAAVSYLAGTNAESITGQTLVLDGGLTVA